MGILIMDGLLGGGIVFDSDPYEEWAETMNKLGSNIQTITTAEEKYTRLQQKQKSNGSSGDGKLPPSSMAPGQKAHIDLAAG